MREGERERGGDDKVGVGCMRGDAHGEARGGGAG